jgi:hypothetical protein
MDESFKSSLDNDNKIDAVTALQDSVDLFSLSIFESLRQLRDGTATGKSTSSTTIEKSDDEDEELGSSAPINSHDSSLVQSLASDVLKKSELIINLTSSIPGMNRTKQQQFEYIQKLLEENSTVVQKLQDAKVEALELRQIVKTELIQSTAYALNITEEI